MHTVRIQAAAIVARRDQVFQPGQVVIHGGQIVEVTSRLDQRPDVDLGEQVILPGLVNPHTHLEFCQLSQPFPSGSNFPQWISSVVNYRRQRDSGKELEQIREDLRCSIEAGLAESRDFGVATLCDIATMPWSLECLPDFDRSMRSMDSPDASAWDRSRVLQHRFPTVVAALEQIGLDENRGAQSDAWRREIEQQYQTGQASTSDRRLLEIALSPHAPYSTAWSFFTAVVQIAKSSDRLLVTHLAESQDELQWLRDGTGAFRDVFERLGIRASEIQRPTVTEVIEQLAGAPRSLLVHGNYLTDQEIQIVAKHRDRMRVAYCPRTHSHFGHEEYPLEKLRRAGIDVVLGTDSRASNPDLNLWQEARHALSLHKSLSPWDALETITLGASQSLGLHHRYGAIAPGFDAVLCVATAPKKKLISTELIEFLFENNHRLIPLWQERLLHDKGASR